MRIAPGRGDGNARISEAGAVGARIVAVFVRLAPAFALTFVLAFVLALGLAVALVAFVGVALAFGRGGDGLADRQGTGGQQQGQGLRRFAAHGRLR